MQRFTMPPVSARSRGALRLGAATLTMFGVLVGGPALAWKPKTHIYLAEEVMRDAVADGKVALYETDYASGRIVGVLGEFEVDAKVLAALKAAPKQFRAGVLGPDAYPDIVTGQTTIHPAESLAIDAGAGGSNAWLTHVWREGFTKSTDPRVNAFAVGYLTHAAGDVFAHTFVNHFAGGEFMLFPDPQNAIKHLTLEGYVGKRTPTTVNAFATTVVTSGSPCNQRKRDDLGLDSVGCGQTRANINAPVTQADTSIAGVESFVLQQMTVVAPGSLLETKLYQGAGTAKSIPYIFSMLRNGLSRDVADYDRIRMSKWGPDRLAYSTLNGPAAEYKRAWVKDIDDGLSAWPGVSHELAKALVYNESGADLSRAEAVINGYVRDHLLSMAGAPDAVVMTANAISDVISAIIPLPLKNAMNALMRAPLDFLVTSATGKSPTEWADYLKNPETHFDEVMTRPGGGHDGEQAQAVTLATFNRDHLKIDDQGYGNPSLKWKIDDLPAAFNTVQLTKMLMLGDVGMDRLRETLRARQADTAQPSDNAMLGWVSSLDHGNQWQGLRTAKAGASPQPFFAANGGAAYQKLLLKVTGEKTWIAAQGSPDRPPPSGESTGAQPPKPSPPPIKPRAPLPKAADAVSVVDMIGDWTSAAGVFLVEKTETGARGELTAPNLDQPNWEVEIIDGAQTAKGEWRMFRGNRINGTLVFQKGAAGEVVVSRVDGDPLAGRPYITLTKVAGSEGEGDWLAQTPAASKADDWSPPEPANTGIVPATGGQVAASGAFQRLSPAWDARFQGARAVESGEVYVVVALRNVSGRDQMTGPGSFISRLRMVDGETVVSRAMYRASGDPPSEFAPVIQPDDELAIRFVFRPAKGGKPTAFSLQANDGGASESPTLRWDVSGVGEVR